MIFCSAKFLKNSIIEQIVNTARMAIKEKGIKESPFILE